MKDHKTALVFAGGENLGANKVGMLRALAEYGVVPDLFVGSFVCAVNAAYFADNLRNFSTGRGCRPLFD